MSRLARIPPGARSTRAWIGMLAAAFVLSAAPTAESATHRQKVDPFAAGWQTAAHASGYCSSHATTTGRADAFRCYRGSYSIEDPCFSSPTASGVVRCVDAPWSRKATEVKVTRALPEAGAGAAPVWAVALANGSHCVIDPGASDTSLGHVIGWTCTNGELAQGLHSGTTWWALWQPSNGAHWKHVSIRTLYS